MPQIPLRPVSFATYVPPTAVFPARSTAACSSSSPLAATSFGTWPSFILRPTASADRAPPPSSAAIFCGACRALRTDPLLSPPCDASFSLTDVPHRFPRHSPSHFLPPSSRPRALSLPIARSQLPAHFAAVRRPRSLSVSELDWILYDDGSDESILTYCGRMYTYAAHGFPLLPCFAWQCHTRPDIPADFVLPASSPQALRAQWLYIEHGLFCRPPPRVVALQAEADTRWAATLRDAAAGRLLPPPSAEHAVDIQRAHRGAKPRVTAPSALPPGTHVRVRCPGSALDGQRGVVVTRSDARTVVGHCAVLTSDDKTSSVRPGHLTRVRDGLSDSSECGSDGESLHSNDSYVPLFDDRGRDDNVFADY